jgi:hypothetical protein
MIPEPVTAVGAAAAAGALWRCVRALGLAEVFKTLARGRVALAMERERRETVIAVTAHVPPGAHLTLGPAVDGGPSVVYTSAGSGGPEGGMDQ